MRRALTIAGLRGLRTTIQGLAGVAGSVPLVTSFVDARVAGVVALWATVGAVIAGVGAFLQNLAEELEVIRLEDEEV